MAPKSKSIFRGPGTQHFQLVHRSQRDPLIHDPEASQHVLKPFVRENNRKGKTRAELEQLLNLSDQAHDQARVNTGEATLHGIYYDDTEYDYMQHLRVAGIHEDGVESTLIEAPVSNQLRSKGKDRALIALRDLPAEALPSRTELPHDYESQQSIPSSIAGFRPDMDPHLRQTLVALEDDAFIDDEIGDDFFAELVQDGERESESSVQYDFAEEGLYHDGSRPRGGAEEEDLGEDASWEARFAAFKERQQREAARTPVSDDDGSASEGADTVGCLPEFPVIGGKKRQRPGSDASGYSMTSSSMFRTDGLRLLDDRFGQIEKEYDEADAEIPDDSDSDDAPELIASREDFEALMDDFLDNYEIHGGKMKLALEGTGAEKLEQLRRALGRDERVRDHDSGESSDGSEEIYAMLEKEDRSDRWDVETVLTTYTNLENHPRLIRALETKPVSKIQLNSRTGLPSVTSDISLSRESEQRRTFPDRSSSHEIRQTVTRARNESKEDKKARKAAVKQEKGARRIEKKATKQQFSEAIRQQSQLIASRDVRTRKL